MNTVTNLKILVADDDDCTRQLVCHVLKSKGYDAMGVASARDAVDAFKVSPHAIVISDIQMESESSGVSLLHAVKEMNPSTQVILITGFATMGSAIAAIRAGAYDYFTKPLEDLQTMIYMVERAAEKWLLTEKNARLVDHLLENNRTLEQNKQMLTEMVVRDGVTGLYNWRYFQDALGREWARARRHKRAFSLVFIDIDHFKPCFLYRGMENRHVDEG